ncbi:MAG: SDR family oxidoreductase [Anaerolineae bacterium]|nr:SDR family oxidoreductase [Anaerolineae bacterium]
MGRSIALALAREGARFVLAARTESELNGVRDEVTALGAEAITVPTDVADPQQIADLAKATLDRFGTVDVIINNAGTGTVLGPVQDTTLEYWESMINTNARSAFLLTKALLPTMLANQSGHVININSTVAKKGVSTASAYCASKAAMAAFGESLAAEVRSEGIRVTNVFCEPMNTWLRWAATPDFARDRVMEPEDVAQVVVDVLKLHRDVMVDDIPVRRR